MFQEQIKSEYNVCKEPEKQILQNSENTSSL